MVDASAVGCLDRVLKCHGVWIAQVEPAVGLGHYDRELSIRREVEVVGIDDGNIFARLAGARIDARETALAAPFGIVRDLERLQIPRRDDMLRILADLVVIDDLVLRRIDNIHVVGLYIRYINARQRI